MEPRAVQHARREEFEGVPAAAFVVDLHTVHACAGPGARYAFCGARVMPGWTYEPGNRWQTGWQPCQSCGEWVAEIDGLAR